MKNKMIDKMIEDNFIIDIIDILELRRFSSEDRKVESERKLWISFLRLCINDIKTCDGGNLLYSSLICLDDDNIESILNLVCSGMSDGLQSKIKEKIVLFLKPYKEKYLEEAYKNKRRVEIDLT